MEPYAGLPEGIIHSIDLPEPLFYDLFPLIDHLGEIKLTLHIIWLLAHKEGMIRFISRSELATDKRLAQSLGTAQSSLEDALQRSLERGTLLEAKLQEQTLYFVNSPQGRAAVQAIAEGRWRATNEDQAPIEVLPPPPNIFRLYEENIGPLTPLIAEALGEAEDDYSEEWILDAIRIAVERNKRSWRYAEAILKRWKREGRDVREKQKDQRESSETRQRYIEGEFSDFVEH